MCLYELYFYFLWRLIFSWHSSSGLLFISSISVWTRSFKKKEKNHCHLVFVLYLWLFCSNMQTLVFPGFFWHCTFNLKCFLYLLDINVLPFLIGLYKFAFFFFFIFFYSDRLLCKNWNVGVVCPQEWRLLFLWCLPLNSCFFSTDIY